MKTLADVVVGDTVLAAPLYRHSGRAVHEVVTGVARVWITTTGGKYRKDTGVGPGDPPQWEAFTEEMLADRELRARLLPVIDRAHFRSLTTDQLSRIVDIIGES